MHKNRWTQIEKLWVVPTHPNSMLWSSDVLMIGGSQLLGPTALLRTLCQRAKSFYPLTTTAFLVTSFLYTPNVLDSLTLQMSYFWMDRALFRYSQLMNTRTRTLRSFQDLQDAFDLPRQAFFSYLQICHYVQSLVPNLQFSPLNEFEKNLSRGHVP